MKLQLRQLILHAKRSTETIDFSPTASFIHGPLGTGKSTVARLVDFCFGGHLEKTPALQQEFVSCELLIGLGRFDIKLERGANDASEVRATWTDDNGALGSVNAPIHTSSTPLIGELDVCNLSDLLFWLAEVAPVKVRSSKEDPDSKLVRLSFRDLLFYCYLPQDDLDSSFFHMADPFKRLKSRDVMRFVTGYVSETLLQLEQQLDGAVIDQRGKRDAVSQLRAFMRQFRFGTDIELLSEITTAERELREVRERREKLETAQKSDTHAAEPRRARLRALSDQINSAQVALADIAERLRQREALLGELVTAKAKAARQYAADVILSDVPYIACPQCGTDVAHRQATPNTCGLCGLIPTAPSDKTHDEQEALRRDLNERIDELQDAIERHKAEHDKQQRAILRLEFTKQREDDALEAELRRYDSAFVSRVRVLVDQEATLRERLQSLERLRAIPDAIAQVERDAATLQGAIDNLRARTDAEKERLRAADQYIDQLAGEFKEVLLQVGFPGVTAVSSVRLEPRDWKPRVKQGDVELTFENSGSGGMKTLFQVCYALAVHRVVADAGLALPSLLLIDSPSKNIISDENRAILLRLYQQIYALARQHPGRPQLVLIDSDLIDPSPELPEFAHRRLANTDAEPGLISYYRPGDDVVDEE